MGDNTAVYLKRRPSSSTFTSLVLSWDYRSRLNNAQITFHINIFIKNETKTHNVYTFLPYPTLTHLQFFFLNYTQIFDYSFVFSVILINIDVTAYVT